MQRGRTGGRVRESSKAQHANSILVSPFSFFHFLPPIFHQNRQNITSIDFVSPRIAGVESGLALSNQVLLLKYSTKLNRHFNITLKELYTMIK